MEQGLCEKYRNDNFGHDTHHPEQRVYFVDPTNMTVSVWQRGSQAATRTEQSDQHDFDQLPKKDDVQPDWRWWEAQDSSLPLFHDWFVRACGENGVRPNRQVYFPNVERPPTKTKSDAFALYEKRLYTARESELKKEKKMCTGD